MKKRIHILFPIVIIPLIIIAIAFMIDPAPVNICSIFISTAIIYSLFLVSYGIFKKIWVSWLITSIPIFLIEIINLYKLQINNTPMLLSDFSLIGGLDKIIGFALPQIEFSPLILVGFGFFFVFTALLIIIESVYKKNKKTRLITLGTGIILISILFVPFTHRNIARLADNDTLTPQQLVIKHGAVAGLYCSGINADGVPKTVLSKEDIQNVIDSYETPVLKSEKPPTIIFLMSESFFDVERLPGISFSEDPIPNFHMLQREFSTGKFLSNAYCGGTGYVEMEFLTGLCSKFLNAMHTLDSLPDKAVYKYIPSISDVFKKNGYSTTFLHSYNSALYNRPFIYETFRFDNVRFDKNFTVPIEYSGGYISDMTLTKEIISVYENAKDAPAMIYAISMENHQPFLADKYSEKSGIEMHCNISNEDMEMFDSYIHGLHNADKALGALIEYFTNVNEPVVIVFWGDHLPNLTTSNESNIYKDLGYCADGESYNLRPKDYFNLLTTDYVIWNNFGLKKEDKALGAPMLGIEVLNRIGLEMNDYFTWLSGYVMDNYLVYSHAIFSPADEKVYSYVPNEFDAAIDGYHQVVYDIIYGEHQLFGEQR